MAGCGQALVGHLVQSWVAGTDVHSMRGRPGHGSQHHGAHSRLGNG